MVAWDGTKVGDLRMFHNSGRDTHKRSALGANDSRRKLIVVWLNPSPYSNAQDLNEKKSPETKTNWSCIGFEKDPLFHKYHQLYKRQERESLSSISWASKASWEIGQQSIE